MFMLRRLGELVDGSDDNLYYSPLKKEPRPIAGILSAFHAVGNMLLWAKTCVDKRIGDTEYLERNIALMLEQMIDLRNALQLTKSLTLLGKLIVETLENELEQESLVGPLSREHVR
jgi:HEXXH motif-containing protein